ncbi:MAG: hypothetical protein JOZ73_11380 [Solirubrobacterales bacterium]|nr:hypothetical protein [Solirubrobacterales bacterium]
MPSGLNALKWDGSPGHYEVYYLTLTDPGTGIGVWIRYTMLAPLPELGQPPSAALWFLIMDPGSGVFGRKETFEISRLQATADPFSLRIGDSELADGRMRGQFEDVSWELEWQPGRGYEHVHPLLRRIASTILVLPHADVTLEGAISFGGRRVEVRGAKGAQAHLWGSKHASSWAWVHCNDFSTSDGEPVDDTFVDGVSVLVPRFGRELGPSTPFVARVDGSDFASRSLIRVLSNDSKFGLTHWRFEAVSGSRKLIGELDAERDQLAGVTYTDPDGQLAYCYNSETASLRLHLFEKSRQIRGWTHTRTLNAPGRAHFEYAQRTPVGGLELLTR